jgi:hypothetical protein
MATAIVSSPASNPDISSKASKLKPIEKYADVDIYEVERSLDHVLQDREIGSNDNSNRLYQYNELDDSKYTLL